MGIKRIGWICGLLLSFLAAGFVLRLAHRGVFRRPTVPVLMYHRVDDTTGDLWTVPPAEFERQMRYLSEQGYEAVLPRDLLADRQSHSQLPRKPVVITFDDGYRSTVTRAEPILSKYGFRAIVYLATSLISDTPEQRQSFEGRECLTWPEVRHAQTRGVLAFGGHSHRHVHLEQMESPREEIETCFRQIAGKTGCRPDAFAYPFGCYNSRASEAVRNAGFTTAVTTAGAFAERGARLKPLTIPRLIVCGGEHHFDVVPLPREPRRRVARFYVTHQGIPMPVNPRLVWKGIAPNDGWLSTRMLTPGTMEWTWVLPDTRPATIASLRLEIWDCNQFFPLETTM